MQRKKREKKSKQTNRNQTKSNRISVWQIDKCHWVIFAVILMSIELYSRNEARKISQIPDWSDGAIAGDHLWQPTSISGDFCYVGETECSVRWQKLIHLLLITIVIFHILSYSHKHMHRTFWNLFSHLFNVHCLRWAFVISVTTHSSAQPSTTQY